MGPWLWVQSPSKVLLWPCYWASTVNGSVASEGSRSLLQ
jgi:hypothetical protein